MNISELIVGLSVLGVYPPGSGGGSVTNVGTGTGLTGGPIITSGVISLAPVSSGNLLANLTGSSAAPLPHSMSAILDYAFSNAQGSILYRSATAWAALPPPVATNLFLRSGGTAANPVWDVPVAGGFDPALTLYFAPTGGNNTNSGSAAFPFETLAKAVTEAQALITGGASFVQIIGLGVGIDTTNVTVTLSGIYIYAPEIQHNPVTGDALTVNITTGGASYINVVLASSTVESGAKVLNLISYVGGNNSVARFTYVGAVTGDVYLNIKCEFYCTIIAGFLTANQAGTNVVTQYGIGGQSQASRLNLEGMLFGGGGGAIHGPMNVTNAWRYPMRQIVYLTGDRTLDYTNSGYLFINNTTNTYTITLPDTAGQGTPPFINGYEATFLNMSTGAIVFSPGGTSTLTGTTVLNQFAQRINVTLTDTDAWEADTPSAIFNLNNVIYVASNGNNDFSGTNINFPISSPQLAVDLIDAMPDHSGLIKFLDAATYNTQINIPGNGVIYFDGPSASIEFDDPILSAVNIANSGINNISIFNMAGINNYAGGQIFNVAGSISNVFLYSQVCQGGIYTEGGFVGKLIALVGSNVEVVSGSQCSLSVINDIFVTASVDGDLYVDSPICNTSTFTVNTGGRLFVDIKNPQSSSVVNAGGTIQGNFGDTIYGNTIFNGTITTENILLDVTSGSPALGYVMTYDGVSTVNLQPAAGGGLSFSDISGTTQAAAANTAYTCLNAAQTTVTLPLTPTYGTTVRIYGVGAGGWILQANTGQTIVYGSASSTTGGNWTSAAGTDSVECTALSDGVTWRINWAVSAGLTPA